jgi:uncharacterized protein involved in outer membrane biogenesis
MALNKPVKIIVIILGGCAVLFAAAVVTLSIMFPPEKIKALALPQIEKAIGRKVDVAGAGVSLYPVFGLKIKGLRIDNTARAEFSADPFITLDEFLIGVKVLPLFSRRLEISAVILRKPCVLVEVDRMGSFNYSDLAFMISKDSGAAPAPEKKKPGAAPALPIPVTMEKFAIEQGKIVYNDYKAGRFITIGAVNHRIGFSIDRALKDITTTGSLVLTGISVRTGEIPKPLSGVSFTFSHDMHVNAIDGEAVINDIRLSLQKVFVACNGSVKNFNTAPVIDLNVKTEKISIADLISEIPVELYPDIRKINAKGFIELAMKLTGTIDEQGIPNLKGTFTLGDGRIQYADLPEPISDIRAAIEFTRNSVVISDLGFNLGNNPVMLKATIENFAMPNVDAALKATINLADLKNIVALPEGVTLSGTVHSDITALGLVDPANPLSMKIDGAVTITDLQAKTPDLPQPVSVNGTVQLTPKQVVEKMQIGIGSSDIAVNSTIVDYLSLIVKDSAKTAPRPKLNFTVASSQLNTDDLLKKTEKPAAPAKATPAEKTPPQTAPAPILAAPLPGVDMNGTVSCKSILYQGIEMKNFTTKISSVNDVMQTNTNATLLGGAMTNSLKLDARNLKNVGITNAFTISKIQVNDFLANVGKLLGEDQPLYKDLKKLDTSVFGTLSLTTDVKTGGATTADATKNLDGKFDARIDNGTIKGNVFTQGINDNISKFASKIKLPIGNLIDLGDIDFQNLKCMALIKNERVIFESFAINSQKSGDWDVGGDMGFDGSLGLKLANRLPKNVSGDILRIQEKLKAPAQQGINTATKSLGDKLGAAGAVAGKALSQVAEKKLDEAFITPDNEGRVTMLINYGGTAAAPKSTGFGFKKFEQTRTTEDAGAPSQKPAIDLKKQVEGTRERLETEVKTQAENAVKQAETKAVETIEKQLPEGTQDEAKKAVQDVKKDAQKKLKKLFK